MKIAIIGGGPAGLSLCIQLKNELLAMRFKSNVEILVFEKNSRIGPGLPYASEEECHILNLPKEIMEPIFREKNKFAQWLTKNKPETKDDLFPARYHFGNYLESMAICAQREAAQAGIKIAYFTENEVFDIKEMESGLFHITAALGDYTVTDVVLCTGHMPSTEFYKLSHQDTFIQCPWDLDAYKSIDPHKTIGIIGTRLTAIDAAIKLRQMNHQGKITMASRSGLLPTVLGRTIPEYNLKYLNLDSLREKTKANFGALKFDELASLFWAEIKEARTHTHLSKIPQSSLDIAPLDWISQEIDEAEHGPRLWQQILFALYPLTPDIWPMLNITDQQCFIKKFNSLFMTYLAAFPLDNAYKIKEMLSSQTLEVRGQLNRIHFENTRSIMTFENGEKIVSDYLINATGPGYDPMHVPLLKKMLAKKLLSKHAFWGINVAPDTLQVLRPNGKKNRHLFAIGELTKGVYFLTTDLGRATAQANKLVKYLVNNLALLHESPPQTV